MGRRKVIIKQSVADSIASIAWFIESKGLVATAEAFADAVYDHFIKMSDTIKSYPLCRESKRAQLGYKCIPYKKKYTIVFMETDRQLIICEFIPSRLIYW